MAREYCSDACYSERKRELRRVSIAPTCATCGQTFSRSSNRQKHCPSCKAAARRQYTRSYNAANADQVRAARRADMAALRSTDPERVRERDRLWRDKNREALNAKRRTPESRKRAADRLRDRYRRDPRVAVHMRMASAIHQALRESKAGRKWESLVGYSLADLIEHLERQFLPGMSWANRSEWHVDHILPKASFRYRTAEDPEFRACWALTNLRPLWSTENQRKHAKRLHLL